MIAKYLATAMLGTTLVAGAAFAQSSTTTPPAASADRASTAAVNAAANVQGTWRASKLVGISVYNDANENLGKINEILVDKTGKINAVILGVGGFLGVGEQNVAVNFDQLKWVDEPVRSAATTTPAMPGGASSKSPSSTVGSTTTLNNANANANAAAHDNWYPDHAVMSGTKEQLKAMPAFKYSDYSK